MIKALQGQVWGLKSFVSSSSKMDEQVTDEAFGERMQRLGNGLQNWVITGFRRAKIGMLLLPSLVLGLFSQWPPSFQIRVQRRSAMRLEAFCVRH